jgi:hypothetical protein
MIVPFAERATPWKLIPCARHKFDVMIANEKNIKCFMLIIKMILKI